MKKKIIAFFLTAIFCVSNSYAIDYDLTFEDARQIALENAQDIKLQEEIINSLQKKESLQKEDYSQNNPDYEYEGITKTPVYNNTYKTYDYEKINKNAKQKKKDMIISNEKKTMELFTDIIKDKNSIKTKIMQLENEKELLKQEKTKLNTGMSTQVDYEIRQNTVDKVQNELKELETKLNLDEKKFKQHLKIDKNSKINLKLIEPNLDLLLPKEALEKTQNNKKLFKDLNEELKELNKDMKWIEQINIGENYTKNTKAQQKLIDKKQEDIKQLKTDTLYKYDKIYYDVLIKANEIQLEKINKSQIEMEKKKVSLMYKQGYDRKISIDELDTKIQENILSQIKKQAEIRWITLNYELDTK